VPLLLKVIGTHVKEGWIDLHKQLERIIDEAMNGSADGKTCGSQYLALLEC
jgi:hypothetical protein